MARFTATDDKDFIDATGYPPNFSHLAHEFSPEERKLMVKNKWSPQDMIALRKLREIMQGKGLSRLPDKDYPRGWEIELDPETREPK
jgi:hypothetical protein